MRAEEPTGAEAQAKASKTLLMPLICTPVRRMTALSRTDPTLLIDCRGLVRRMHRDQNGPRDESETVGEGKQ